MLSTFQSQTVVALTPPNGPGGLDSTHPLDSAWSTRRVELDTCSSVGLNVSQWAGWAKWAGPNESV